MQPTQQDFCAMPELTIEFKWYKDAKGYRLVPGRWPKLRPGESILDRPSSDVEVARIVRNGGALQSYQPFKIPNLFKRFIDAARSNEDMLAFVQKFGPLTNDGLRGKGDVVAELIEHADNMMQTFRGQMVAMPLKKLNVLLMANHKGEVTLKVSPGCLLDALWLELAQSKSVTKIRECLQCQRPFMVGKGTNRRADAKFCSDECRVKYNSLQRSR
jgi:hypothetical protein